MIGKFSDIKWLVGLFITTAVWGQSSQVEESVRMKFSVLSWQRTIHDVNYQNLNGEETSFFVPNGSPSKVYEYSGMNPLHFYKYTGKEFDGNPVREVIASHTPVEGSERLLLFIQDGSAEKEHYRLLSLDYAPGSMQEHSYRFYNIASYPIYIRFGDERFKIEAGAYHTIFADPSSGDGLDVAMAMQVSEEPNSAKLVYSAGWTIRAGRSALVFITNDRGFKGQVDVKRIYF